MVALPEILYFLRPERVKFGYHLSWMAMQILTHVQKNSYIIELNGVLDNKNAYMVKHALTDALQHNPKEVMVDCEFLDAISPRSLKYLRNTARTLQQKQIGLVLISVNSHLNEVFTCMGMKNLIRQVSSSSLISCDEHSDIYLQKI